VQGIDNALLLLLLLLLFRATQPPCQPANQPTTHAGSLARAAARPPPSQIRDPPSPLSPPRSSLSFVVPAAIPFCPITRSTGLKVESPVRLSPLSGCQAAAPSPPRGSGKGRHPVTATRKRQRPPSTLKPKPSPPPPPTNSKSRHYWQEEVSPHCSSFFPTSRRTANFHPNLATAAKRAEKGAN